MSINDLPVEPRVRFIFHSFLQGQCCHHGDRQLALGKSREEFDDNDRCGDENDKEDPRQRSGVKENVDDVENKFAVAVIGGIHYIHVVWR